MLEKEDNDASVHRRSALVHLMYARRRDNNWDFIQVCACWLLVLVTAAIPSTASAAMPSATIETCFAPENDCAAFAVQAIDHARREILVGAYGLTTGSGIVEALVRAY